MSKRKYEETIVSEAANILQKHLHKSRVLLDKLDSPEELKKQLKELERAIDAQNVLIANITAYKKDYAKAMLDLCKRNEINVGHTQKKLQTVPWLMGKNRYDAEQEEIRKKQEKKLKKKKL